MGLGTGWSEGAMFAPPQLAALPDMSKSRLCLDHVLGGVYCILPNTVLSITRLWEGKEERKESIGINELHIGSKK